VPIAATIKRVGSDKVIEETVPRQNLWEAQTPQVFRRQLLLDAYAGREGFAATDEAQLVERLGHPVSVVPGSPVNMKITTKEDHRLAERALKALPKPKLDGPIHPFAGDDMWR
jgi:2-C-methyl-D-erythritol 4-phosphate cytidylyltransferase